MGAANKTMQKLLGYLRSCIEYYDMIAQGDRLAVGLSGGKDSVAMLTALARLRDFYPQSFTLTAISVDPCFGGIETDYSALQALCVSLEIPYFIRHTELGTIIFEERKEKNPCSLCAKMRRGILHDVVKEAGCNKLALGHHLDDAAETLLMNLFNGGRIACFSPVTYLSRKDITVLRPMLFARESDAQRVVKNLALPVVKSVCPADGMTERQDVKMLLTALEKKYGGIRHKLLHAMQTDGVSGF